MYQFPNVQCVASLVHNVSIPKSAMGQFSNAQYIGSLAYNVLAP